MKLIDMVAELLLERPNMTPPEIKRELGDRTKSTVDSIRATVCTLRDSGRIPERSAQVIEMIEALLNDQPNLTAVDVFTEIGEKVQTNLPAVRSIMYQLRKSKRVPPSKYGKYIPRTKKEPEPKKPLPKPPEGAAGSGRRYAYSTYRRDL